MQIITKEEFILRKDELLDKIKHGAIFIHPTDTIYGLGCSALDGKAVKKIREIKGRPSKGFSVIAPSIEWIRENVHIKSEAFEDWLEKLPGPYTFICEVKHKGIVASEINPEGNTIGMRVPHHWFTEVAKMAKIPLVTTSANKLGKDFMTSLDDLDPEIKKHVDFIIYEGEKKGRPSQIVFLDQTDEVKVRVR